MQLIETVAALTKRVGEFEARLGLPPKTPDNSSVPPSHGRKASGGGSEPKAKVKPHRGAHRALHPEPTARRDIRTGSCPHCGADVSQAPQNPRDA